MKRLFIIGFGPGDETLLTEKSKKTILSAQRTLNTREMHLSELFLELRNPLIDKTAVLVSGDSGFFSVTKTIIKDFSDLYEITVIPGLSSIQYFSAIIKVSYEDAVLTSLHGKNGNITAKVSYNKKVFALTGGANNIRNICDALCRHGLGNLDICVGERLSLPDERILWDKAKRLKDMDFDSLSVMYIENKSAVNPHIPLRDSEFVRAEVPMTKEEIRWLSIQKLGICSHEIIYDIGAGTGSVSVEMARKAFDGFIYAIEIEEEACALIRENVAKHGAFNVEIIHGEAPRSLDDLPIPDRAFIGGSSGNMDGILNKLITINPHIKIVATAITLQTLHQITEGFEKYGLINTEIICVNIAKSKEIGCGSDEQPANPCSRRRHMMTAQNPVYIISGSGLPQGQKEPLAAHSYNGGSCCE